jgi:hypothetical protein
MSRHIHHAALAMSGLLLATVVALYIISQTGL